MVNMSMRILQLLQYPTYVYCWILAHPPATNQTHGPGLSVKYSKILNFLPFLWNKENDRTNTNLLFHRSWVVHRHVSSMSRRLTYSPCWWWYQELLIDPRLPPSPPCYIPLLHHWFHLLVCLSQLNTVRQGCKFLIQNCTSCSSNVDIFPYTHLNFLKLFLVNVKCQILITCN